MKVLKLQVYTLASFGAGLVGAVYSPASCASRPPPRSMRTGCVAAIFIVVIGGIGTLEGPILGTAIFFALRWLLADYGTWYWLVMGAVAVAWSSSRRPASGDTCGRAGILQLLPLQRRLILSGPEPQRSVQTLRIGRKDRSWEDMSMPKIDFPDAEAGVHSIFQFGLAVPDLEEQERFLKAFGVEPARAGDRIEIRAGGRRPCLGDDREIGNAEEEAAIHLARLLRAGLRPDPRPGRGGRRRVLQRPSGRTGRRVLVPGSVRPAHPGARCAKDNAGLEVAMADLNVPPNVRGAPARSAAETVKSTRLSHMALFTPDLDRVLNFYTRALGLRLADRSGDIIAFTYGRHGSDHHMLAFATGPALGLHHSSWDMPSVESLGLANTQLRAAGYNIHWGPGRHVLGSNYFNYTRRQMGPALGEQLPHRLHREGRDLADRQFRG